MMCPHSSELGWLLGSSVFYQRTIAITESIKILTLLKREGGPVIQNHSWTHKTRFAYAFQHFRWSVGTPRMNLLAGEEKCAKVDHNYILY